MATNPFLDVLRVQMQMAAQRKLMEQQLEAQRKLQEAQLQQERELKTYELEFNRPLREAQIEAARAETALRKAQTQQESLQSQAAAINQQIGMMQAGATPVGEGPVKMRMTDPVTNQTIEYELTPNAIVNMETVKAGLDLRVKQKFEDEQIRLMGLDPANPVARSAYYAYANASRIQPGTDPRAALAQVEGTIALLDELEQTPHVKALRKSMERTAKTLRAEIDRELQVRSLRPSAQEAAIERYTQAVIGKMMSVAKPISSNKEGVGSAFQIALPLLKMTEDLATMQKVMDEVGVPAEARHVVLGSVISTLNRTVGNASPLDTQVRGEQVR